MGQKESSPVVFTLKKKDIRNYMQQTHFDQDEIEALHSHFFEIASRNSKDGAIDKSEFRASLGVKETLFLDRLFALFDENNKGCISFAEFIKGLSVLCTRGTLEEKTKLSFRMYDFDGDGKISKQELSSMLETSLKENGVKITPEQLGTLVSSTFEKVDKKKDGFIDFEEYKYLVDTNPSILDDMTLDFKRVVEQRLDTLRRNKKHITHVKSER